MNIDRKDYEKVMINGFPDLETILKHYQAIPILINRLKDLGEGETLRNWDKARSKSERKYY